MPWRRGGAAPAAPLGTEASQNVRASLLWLLPAIEAIVAVACLGVVSLHDAVAGGEHELGLKQWMAGVAAVLLAVDAALRGHDPSRRGLLSRLSSADALGRIAFLTLAGALLAITVFAFRGYQVDDSFITFRYAQNLLASGQVTWNVGEAPVEGYSNFLWMLLAAGSLALGLDPLAVSRGVSFVAILVSAWLVHRLARRLGATSAGARLSALTFLAIPAFMFWAMSGLETASSVALGLALLEVMAADMERDRLPWRAALVATVLLLSRPEAPLFIALAAAPLLWAGGPSGRRRALQFAGVTATLIAPYLTWKWLTFGSLVANSAVAKSGALRGLPIVTQAYLFVFPFVLLAAARVARGIGRLEQQILLLAIGHALAGLHVATQVAHQFRFFLPVIAGLCVIAGPALEALTVDGVPANRRRMAFTAVVTALLLFTLSPILDLQTYAHMESRALGRAHTRIGHQLAATYHGEGLLAASDCGLIPYHSQMSTIDLWGLNDASIARDGLDVTAVMARRPDVVILHSLQPDRFRARESYDLAMHPAVLREPGLVLRARVEFAGYWLWVWSRRPLAESSSDPIEFTNGELVGASHDRLAIPRVRTRGVGAQTHRAVPHPS